MDAAARSVSEGTALSTIGLCMIAKNEAAVIERCIASARPLVDHVLVVDTGSTDGTQEIVRGLGGVVVEQPWRDFAYNRTRALAECNRLDLDYVLMLDADDELVIECDPEKFASSLYHDLYDVPIRYGSIRYARPQLLRCGMPFYFKGVLHEYLECDEPFTRAPAEGIAIQVGNDGARSRNPSKFEDDAALLEKELVTERNPFLRARYTFYLAQSYRDCGQGERAIAAYMRRATLGYWAEEVYVSFLEAGDLMAQLRWPHETVMAAYSAAARTVPGRAEAWYAMEVFCAGQRSGMRAPEGALFLRPASYDERSKQAP
jgi:glycosyltransferase involved in cell wall biosynthesis